MAVKYSHNFSAMQARIKRLPDMMEDMVSGATKRDLIEINKIFHDGIKRDSLGLDRLAETTVSAKRRKGYNKPDAPLYGKGDEEQERSYMNMMNIRKLTRSWKLYPSERMHWSKKIKLSDLFKIHEHGATIRRQTANGVTFIRIPPRPALLLAYLQWQNKRMKKDKVIKKAIKEFIIKGNDKLMKNLSDYVIRNDMKVANG